MARSPLELLPRSPLPPHRIQPLGPLPFPQVASLLAVCRAYGIDASMTRAQLGEAGRVCELYIGTMSGGMDQAISSMANVRAHPRPSPPVC